MTTNQTILILEDDEVDVMAIRRALKEFNVKNPLAVCSNGEEGLRWLSGNPRPGLILLDIRMPVMDGLEFLKRVKENPQMRLVPVVALTTSREEGDKFRAFDLGISGFMVKPVEPSTYLSVLQTIAVYWQTSELPY
jgi:CheY-like chemotaxis protein